MAHCSDLQVHFFWSTKPPLFDKIPENSLLFQKIHYFFEKFQKIHYFSEKSEKTRECPCYSGECPCYSGECPCYSGNGCATVGVAVPGPVPRGGAPPTTSRWLTHYPGYHYPMHHTVLVVRMPAPRVSAGVCSSPGSFSVRHIE